MWCALCEQEHTTVGLRMDLDSEGAAVLTSALEQELSTKLDGKLLECAKLVRVVWCGACGVGVM